METLKFNPHAKRPSYFFSVLNTYVRKAYLVELLVFLDSVSASKLVEPGIWQALSFPYTTAKFTVPSHTSHNIGICNCNGVIRLYSNMLVVNSRTSTQ